MNASHSLKPVGSFFLTLSVFLAVLSVPEATWGTPRAAQPERWCLRALTREGVAYKRGPASKNIRTPVILTDGRIGKLILQNGRKRAKPLMDCRMAFILLKTQRIFSANGGIRSLIVGNFYSYRMVKNSSHLSRHAYGLAMDLYGVVTDKGQTYMVDADYERHLGRGPTCEGHARRRGGRLLRQLACDLDKTKYFKAILTPDSDRDHRDHFHLSIYKDGEDRARKNRTTLVEPVHFGRKWARQLPTGGFPSSSRVTGILKQRYRANRRISRSRSRKRR
ncbi:MAG: hypothetical protein CVU59_09490 [Deltaproteobacteria bacterium HGW-Deltaproteobacteria-17]|nr:MAG: hypothetical protein CVU59_09490 [Deltaproteobacteria bacterium HGW-Deltaproteobacteria-17]